MNKQENKVKKKSFFSTGFFIQVVILVILYVIIGNTETIRANPIIPGAIVAVNMIVIVLAGILYGWRVGLAVGLVGTLINAFTPMGSSFEFAAIIPHSIMGFFAGYIKEKSNIAVASLSIIIGHVLNIIMFLITGLLVASILNEANFWYGLLYETVFGIVAIMVLGYLYCMIFRRKHKV